MGIDLAIFAIWLLALAWCVAMFFRAGWVGKQRLKLIDRHYQGPNPLSTRWDADYLSFDQMMRRFWIWDIERLRK